MVDDNLITLKTFNASELFFIYLLKENKYFHRALGAYQCATLIKPLFKLAKSRKLLTIMIDFIFQGFL